jgi:enterochelin esterase-like enzyme
MMIRVAISAVVVLLASTVQAQPVQLARGAAPIERTIKAGETHEYEVTLRTGEFLRATVDQRGMAIQVRGFFPDGTKIRSFNGPATGPKLIRFVGESSGAYRLELRPNDSTGAGSYRIQIDDIQPMADRLKIAPGERYRSPRIDRLRQEMLGGSGTALSTFWRQVSAEGTPLAESIPGDDDYLFVTFLWRAVFDTYNVVVAWAPYFERQPAEYQMSRLADTDLWYKTLRIRKGARFTYQLSPNDTLTTASNAQRYATAQVDPLNPRRRPADPTLTKYEVLSIAELPGASPQPWADPRVGIPTGTIVEQKIASRRLQNERSVWIYLPAGYTAASRTTHPLMVLFDASSYLTLGAVRPTLDNLIAENKIPPVVVALIGSISDNVRNRELPCNPEFAEFLDQELVPWLRGNYRVTTNPRDVVVGGVSHGGLAAVCAAMRHPETFGNVLSQSGTVWWFPGADLNEIALRTGDRESNWVARQFIERPKLPVRFFLEAGLFENDVFGSGGQILETNRHLRDVLRAKGYDVHYQDFVGGHDWLNWRGSLADGIITLLGSGPPR